LGRGPPRQGRGTKGRKENDGVKEQEEEEAGERKEGRERVKVPYQHFFSPLPARGIAREGSRGAWPPVAEVFRGPRICQKCVFSTQLLWPQCKILATPLLPAYCSITQASATQISGSLT